MNFVMWALFYQEDSFHDSFITFEDAFMLILGKYFVEFLTSTFYPFFFLSYKHFLH